MGCAFRLSVFGANEGVELALEGPACVGFGVFANFGVLLIFAGMVVGVAEGAATGGGGAAGEGCDVVTVEGGIVGFWGVAEFKGSGTTGGPGRVVGVTG